MSKNGIYCYTTGIKNTGTVLNEVSALHLIVLQVESSFEDPENIIILPKLQYGNKLIFIQIFIQKQK